MSKFNNLMKKNDNKKSKDKNQLLDLINQNSKSILTVKTDLLYSSEQVRKNFNEGALLELGNSMKNDGQHHPITVSPSDRKGYLIQKGERRWRAAKLVGIDVDIVIRQPSNDECKEFIGQVTENIQVESLTPFEIADAIHALKHKYNLRTEEIKAALNKSDGYISKHLKLLELPSDVKALYLSGQVQDVETLNILRKSYDLNSNKTSELLSTMPADGITRVKAKEFHESLKKKTNLKANKPAINTSGKKKQSATENNNAGTKEAFITCQPEEIQFLVEVDGEIGTLMTDRLDPNGTHVEVKMQNGTFSLPISKCSLKGVTRSTDNTGDYRVG